MSVNDGSQPEGCGFEPVAFHVMKVFCLLWLPPTVKVSHLVDWWFLFDSATGIDSWTVLFNSLLFSVDQWRKFVVWHVKNIRYLLVILFCFFLMNSVMVDPDRKLTLCGFYWISHHIQFQSTSLHVSRHANIIECCFFWGTFNPETLVKSPSEKGFHVRQRVEDLRPEPVLCQRE